MSELTQSIFNSAKQDRFSATLCYPNCVRPDLVKHGSFTKFYGNSLDSVQYRIIDFNAPEVGVNASDVFYAGQSMSVSDYSRPKYEDLNISFLVDNRFLNYYSLWQWTNYLNNAMKGWSDADDRFLAAESGLPLTPADYLGSMAVSVLDEFNEPIIKFQYSGLVIKKLSRMEFAYNKEDDIKVIATFGYFQFNVEPIDNVQNT